MIANLILGIVCTLALLLLKNKELTLRYVFFVITFFLAIRYGWGNDYFNYLYDFEEIQSSNIGLFDYKGYSDLLNHEIGWSFLMNLFGSLHLGFFGFIIALTVFQNYLIYRFLSKYVEPRYYWLAVLLYVLNTRIFAVGASMLRHYFCICCFIYVIELMSEKRKRCLLWSILIILLCSTIHRTNFVMLLTLPVFYIKIETNRNSIIWSFVIFLVYLVWSQVGPTIFQNNLLQVLETDESLTRYANYMGGENAATNSGLGVIFINIMMIVWMFSIPNIDKKRQPILIFFLVSYFFMPLSAVVPMFSRFTMYCSICSFALWPWLLSQAQSKKNVFLLSLVVLELLVVLKTFFDFFHNPTWHDHFYYYHTIFNAHQWM